MRAERSLVFRGKWTLLVLLAFLPAAGQEDPGPELVPEGQLVCPFCRSMQSPDAFLCNSCGRMFRTLDLDPARRFWADAYYIFRLPSITSRPELKAEVGPEGLERETAKFDLGDRYEYELTEKGVRISGRIRVVNSNEVKYSASVTDEHDDSGSLRQRVVHGRLDSKPKRFLYRRIEYRYDGERIVGIEVGTYVYAKAQDWDKRPAEWIRHNKAEIDLVERDGVLVEIRVERCEGERDLRGRADYAECESFTERVETEFGWVAGFGAPQEE